MSGTLKRTKYIGIRLTEAEHEQLLERSMSPRLAKWIREHCLAAAVPDAHRVLRIDPALLRQLAGLGNNVNQIARAVNSEQWNPIERVEVLARLSAIQRDLERLKVAARG